ncbi:alpha/beta hydrolase [Amycolatopsis sp. NPDC051102]|uniref:esterase/lipase family protein n=1 Tax=Amycolatopsis sp. NPDC051102 TaxID=3155163 RepID=UPI0034440329
MPKTPDRALSRLTGWAAVAAAIPRLPALLARDYWTGSVVESAAGHRMTGITHGLFGARLPASGHGAGAEMTVRSDRQPVGVDSRSLATAFPGATGSLAVFVHGLVETERSWFRGPAPGADFGSRLADDLGVTPVHVRYNTGHHVSENGRDLAALLSRLIAAWPVPVTDVVLIGHSMGGLVARSALYQAQERNPPWLSRVTRLVCLGTPHSGAPLERRVAQFVDLLGKSPVTAPLTWLLALRSDGIQDLAHGYLHHRQWAGGPGTERPPEPAPPAGVRRLFVSATLSRTQGSTWGRLFGDLLVTPVNAGDLPEEADIAWLGGMNHFGLLRDDAVYATLLGWLRDTTRPASGQPT